MEGVASIIGIDGPISVLLLNLLLFLFLALLETGVGLGGIATLSVELDGFISSRVSPENSSIFRFAMVPFIVADVVPGDASTESDEALRLVARSPSRPSIAVSSFFMVVLSQKAVGFIMFSLAITVAVDILQV
jgi:hypothetical protein